jgi:hypothetical protein
MPVSVKGAVNLRKALRAYTPDLAKQMPKEIAAALKPVVKVARGYVPDNGSILSGWRTRENYTGRFPLFDSRSVKAGISYKTTPSKANSRGFRSLARLLNKTAAGAIYETMGRKTPNSQFVQNQRSKYGAQFKGKGKEEGAVLFRAYDEDRGAARDGVLKAIEKANRDFKAATA